MRVFKFLFLLFIILFLTCVLLIAVYKPTSNLKYSSKLLVVPGAGFLSNGKPVLALEKRLTKSISLWNKETIIMISGTEKEISVMGQYLQKHGVNVTNIIADSEGINTRKTVINAYYYAGILNTTPTFISQAYHLPRIRLYNFIYGDCKANFISTNRVGVSSFELIYVSLREICAIMVFPFIMLFDMWENFK